MSLKTLIDLNGLSRFKEKIDASRQAKITANGLLKGDGNGGVSAAVSGTDYGTYTKPSGGIPASDLASEVLSGYATQTWVTQQGYLKLSDLPVYNGGVS